MKIWTLLFAALLSLSSQALERLPSSVRDSDGTARIHLEAQLWQRAVADPDPTKFTLLSALEPIEASLLPLADHKLARLEVEAKEIRSELLFVLVTPAAPEAPYVVTQVKIFHPTVGLLAQCSNFDSTANEKAIGVGGCSGVLDGVQYGLTLRKP